MENSFTNFSKFINTLKGDWGVTIGNFDGVHLGHQHLINKLISSCEEKGLNSLILTFNPHPKAIFTSNLKLITTYDKRLKYLKKQHSQEVFEVEFTRDFSTCSPDDFLEKFLFASHKVKHLVIGHDFKFGKNKAGDIKFIRSFILEKSLDISVEQVDALKVDDHLVCSSLIREKVSEGNVKLAHRFLGKAYTCSGIVIKGEGKGKQIGFPTANIKLNPDLIYPLNGVYKTKVIYKDRVMNSITNVGTKPTVSNLDIKNIETHIIDFDEDIYGEYLEVQFIDFIREERKFSGIDELVEQIKLDVNQL